MRRSKEEIRTDKGIAYISYSRFYQIDKAENGTNTGFQIYMHAIFQALRKLGIEKRVPKGSALWHKRI